MVLITGSTGFVGMNLLQKLSKTKVVALYRSERKKRLVEDFFKTTNSRIENIIWRKSDINNIICLEEAFDGITHVYHCAGFISFSNSDKEKLYKINIRGTANIVNLCIDKKITKLVYLSSISALGEEVNKIEVNENTIWNNTHDKTFYSYSKYNAELEVWRGIEEGLQVVIINPGIIMGKCIKTDTPQSKIEKMLIKSPFCFFTKGKSGFVNVNDVVEVSIKLMRSNISNERFIIVAKNYSYLTIIAKLKQNLNLRKATLSLNKRILYMILFFDFIFSFIGLKKMYLSIGLIKSIFNKRLYNGDKIIKFLPNFKYTDI
ncbi:MAG: NAD-dependent epimerase/dehydratase family protein [Flavobacteriaceae bacterium]|nr:NAD-dependent epimerase/dehydratase family protein [Flavobacteriaceae bacterium]